MAHRRHSSYPFVKKPLPPPTRDDGDLVSSAETILQHDDDDAENEHEHVIERHLTLTDLISIGVGGTIGSGLFVLSGLVAHEYAGPSTVISWAISGCAACLSGCCYAELSARIPLAGSCYAYAYVAMGELPAVLAAACLSLEYIVAAAAVSRSWSDKVIAWLGDEFGNHAWIQTLLNADGTASPLAFCISTATIVLLLNGVKESKKVANAFTLLKVGVVCFMVVVGAFHVQPSNWKPFLPFGVSGVFRGATGTFFGYLGYDEVSCLAGEALDPKRNLPRAILFTLSGASVLYMIATLVLTGLQYWQDISPISGFPMALYSNNLNVAGQITALGELVTLPLVILIAIMAQPRLQYAMAVDGLLPPMFRELDQRGNLWKGTLVSGILMVFISTFIPFAKLNDMISCAVLSALSITDTSLILLWHEPTSGLDSSLANRLVICFHIAAFLTALLVTNCTSFVGVVLIPTGLAILVGLAYAIHHLCPRAPIFGGSSNRHHYHEDELLKDDGYFRTPLVPGLPCFAICVNYYLIAQLEILGILAFLSFLGTVTLYYFIYAAHHSVVAGASHTKVEEVEMETKNPSSDEGTGLIRSSSPQSLDGADDVQ